MVIDKRVLILLLCMIGLNTAHASLITKGFQWLGDGGYKAQGTLIYDDNFTTVTDSAGINFLEISFFDPSNALVFNTIDVQNGVVLYGSLDLTFDATTMEFLGSFDMGADTGNPGELFLAGDIGGASDLTDSETFATLDQIGVDTSITVFDIPEPGILALVGLGLAGIRFQRNRQARS